MRPPMYRDKEETIDDFYAAMLIGFHGRWGKAIPLSDVNLVKELPPFCWLPNDAAGLERLRSHMEAERSALDRGRLAVRVARGELVDLLETVTGRDRDHFDVEAVPYSMTEALDTSGVSTLIRLCGVRDLTRAQDPPCVHCTICTRRITSQMRLRNAFLIMWPVVTPRLLGPTRSCLRTLCLRLRWDLSRCRRGMHPAWLSCVHLAWLRLCLLRGFYPLKRLTTSDTLCHCHLLSLLYSA